MDARAHVGIVVIGRNEGARLARSLASLAGSGCPVVYVDSDSSDNSREIAATSGIEVLKLEKPLSAARARNAGFERLLEGQSQLRFVQFLDGDCTLQPGWIEAARRDRKSTRLNSSHSQISYARVCLKKISR